MKTNILKRFFITIVLATGLFSCTQDPEIENSTFEVATRSMSEANAEVDYYYLGDEKLYLNIRRDRVIVKTSSEAETERLSKMNLFLPDKKVSMLGKWALASVDAKRTDLKSERAYDITYGLEYDGMLCYPTNEIFVLPLERESIVDILGKAGISEYVEKFEPMNPQSSVYLVTLNVKLDDILGISRDVYETGMCKFAEPNFFRHAKPGNEHYPMQWGFNNTGQSGATPGIDINAEQAWTITRGSPNIKVAVLDDGVDKTHPDLQANIYGGYDSTNAPVGVNGNPYMEAPYDHINTHGTACAGIIGAVNNNIGVVGVASGSKIVPVRIAWDDDGSDRFWISNDNWTQMGVYYAWHVAGADILSNSWEGGGTATDAEFVEAMTRGRNGKGCVVVFGTGNDDLRNYANLGSHAIGIIDPRVITVGAIHETGERIRKPNFSWGSNYGTGLDVMAPGIRTPTTDLHGDVGKHSGNYLSNLTNLFGGTSAACPHVAGVAALILSVNPNLTAKQVADIIESTAQKVGGYSYANTSGRPNGTWNEEMGYGLVDAYAAVSMASLSSSIPQAVTGPDAPQINTNATYSIPTTSLPSGVIFNGWTVSPGSHTITGGTNNSLLRVSFSSATSYTVTANFTLPGNVAYSTSKTVDAKDYYAPPTISSNYTTISEGGIVTFTASATFPNVNYLWEIISGGTMYYDSGGNTIMVTANPGASVINVRCRTIYMPSGIFSNWGTKYVPIITWAPAPQEDEEETETEETEVAVM